MTPPLDIDPRPTTEPRTLPCGCVVDDYQLLMSCSEAHSPYSTEAAQGAAPLDSERLARAIALHREQSSAKAQGCDHNCSPGIAEMYDRLSEEAAPRAEGLDWHHIGALIGDALDYTNDGAVIAKAIRDYLLEGEKS